MPQELKKRLLFTFFMICIYRLGTYIPIPGVDAASISKILGDTSDVKNIFGMANIFSGGAIERVSIFSLSMMPYITASILVQLLSSISAYFKSLKEEGGDGKNKLNQITRYITVTLAAIQAFAIHNAVIYKYSSFLSTESYIVPSVVITVTSLVAGAIMLMWIGEKISVSGIGNGISILVLVGIVSSIPSTIIQSFGFLKTGFYSTYSVIKIIIFSLLSLLVVCFVEKTYKMIKINYPSSNPKTGGLNTSYLPLKVNTSGVIPPIFASSVIIFFSALIQFFKIKSPIILDLATRGSLANSIIFSFLIVFFSQFYSSVVFDPKEISENLKKSGCIISGIRPGNATETFLSSILSKLGILGSIYLVIICMIPEISNLEGGPEIYVGGTAILIIVNVASDLTFQIRSYFINPDNMNRVKRKRRIRRIKL